MLDGSFDAEPSATIWELCSSRKINKSVPYENRAFYDYTINESVKIMYLTFTYGHTQTKTIIQITVYDDHYYTVTEYYSTTNAVQHL